MATLQENIDTIQDTLDDIHDAIIAKGGTTSGTDITSYASGINNLSSLGIPREVSAEGVYQSPTNLFTFSLPSNVVGIGSYGLYYALQYTTSLTSVDLHQIISLGNRALQSAFNSCPNLTSVDFSSLSIINGTNCFSSAFSYCTSLTTLSFPALTSTSFGSYTNQFNGMLLGVTGCTVHFPSNLQSVIGSWSSVTSGFSGTNTTVLFDLTATS